MDLELVVGVLAVAGVLTGLALPAWVAGRRGEDRKRKTFGYLAVAVMEAVFVWTAVLMWRHVLTDGTHLPDALVATILAGAGLFAIVVDTTRALQRPRNPNSAVTGNDRVRDVTRR